MLSHYVKVSFRELLKYRTQSIVSIIGLAVGFTAFILGGYWLKHNKAIIKIDSHLLELINKCHAYIACVWHKFIAFNRHYHISEFQAPSAKRERPKKL